MSLVVRILDATNASLPVALDSGTSQAPGFLPLGTVGSAASTEMFLKVGVISSAGTATVTALPKQYTTASNFTLGGATTAQTVFTLTSGQKGFIQNQATVPLNFKYGATASSVSLSGVLKGASTALDGTGGSIVVDDWAGAVSVFPQSGTSSYIAWVLS